MGALNVDKYIEQLMRGELLSESNIKDLCEKLRLQLIEDPNVASVRAPVTVVGDIHGFASYLQELN
jgi:hypothetical protein